METVCYRRYSGENLGTKCVKLRKKCQTYHLSHNWDVKVEFETSTNG